MRTNDALMHFLCQIEEKVELNSIFSLTHSIHWDPNTTTQIPKMSMTIWASYIYPDSDSWEYRTTSPEELAKNQLAYRYLKKFFGPFSAEGEAPNVFLKGERMVNTDLGQYHVSISVFGAYKCEIVTEEEVTPTEEEMAENRRRAAKLEQDADRLRTLQTVNKKTWRCVSTTSTKL